MDQPDASYAPAVVVSTAIPMIWQQGTIAEDFITACCMMNMLTTTSTCDMVGSISSSGRVPSGRSRSQKVISSISFD